MKEPIVSVIIVTYNAESTLEDAIKSVLNQTYNEIDFLIIDGESIDSTLDIVKKYNLRYLSEKDKGIYDAMNKGVLNAQGEWIYFLGADDVLEHDAIEMLISYSNNYDVIYGNYTTVLPNGIENKMYSLNYNVVKYKIFGNHQSIMMRRKVITDLGGFDITFKLAADFDLIQRAYLQHYRFKQIQNFIARFSLGGISSNNYETSAEWWRICKKNNSFPFPFLCGLYSLLRDFKNKLKQNCLIH